MAGKASESLNEGRDVCEFWTPSLRLCQEVAAATIEMPPAAPKPYRRCCDKHARRFEAIGERVVRDV